METPEHDARLDDPTGDVDEDREDQDELAIDESEESAGAPEGPTGP